MAALKIGTLNVNGLQRCLTQIADFILVNSLQILFVQETHTLDHDVINDWALKNNLLFFGNSRYGNTYDRVFKQGTAILINKTLLDTKEIVFTSFSIVPNRIQGLSFCINRSNYFFVNIYLPSGTSSRPLQLRQQCIASLMDYLNDTSKADKLYLVGDFNLVLNSHDCTGKFRPNSADKLCFEKLINDNNLADAHSTKNFQKVVFTFTRPNSASRLDRIYIPFEDTQNISNVSYLSCCFSDHVQCPVISINGKQMAARRSTYWKLNDSLLSKSTNLSIIQMHLSTLLQVQTSRYDPLERWEKLKTKAKRYLIFLASRDQIQTKRKELLLKNKLASSSIKQNMSQITNITRELHMIEAQRYSGATIRSRKLLIENDEIPVRKFLTFEKNKQKRLVINQISPQTSTPITNPALIRKIFYQHYNDLWNILPAQFDTQDYLSDVKSIDQAHIESLHTPTLCISREEVKDAVNSLNKHSSPGSDGLTASFYSMFPLLIPVLTETFNNALLLKHLSCSQRKALVKLIPKVSQPKSIKDWRPISLLNTDYKILALIISKRLKPLLKLYISPEQQCGLPNRHIFNNHLDIKSAIDYANDISHPLAIIQIDFRKAFDSISHQFILDIAHHIGIPSAVLSWIKVILASVSSQLIINGQQSEPIPIKRGIRQGCPLSMLLFILGIEPLTQKINQDPTIRGITLGKQHLKVLHFADDVILFLTDPQSIVMVNRILQSFSHFSGMKINPTKTKILSNSELLISTFSETFPGGQVQSSAKILGINFSFRTKVLEKRNWKPMCANIMRLCVNNAYRDVSIYGKVAIINSTILPRILFLSRIIYPSYKRVKCLISCVIKFLWNNSKFEPIERESLYRPKQDGGIAFPSIPAKIKTAFSWQLIHILKSDRLTPKTFWNAYARYSLGSKIKIFGESVYSNSEPHRPCPNATWKKILKIVTESNLDGQDLTEYNFKTLYGKILNLQPLPLPTINSRHPPRSWMKIALMEPDPKVFSNKEKELSYRIARKGFLWGSFFKSKNIEGLDPNKLNCKLCPKGDDHPNHVFYDCTTIRKLLLNIEKNFHNLTKIRIKLTKSVMLYNESGKDTKLHTIIIKLAAITRKEIFDLRLLLETQKKSVNTQLLKETNFKIRSKFKRVFLENQWNISNTDLQ